MLNECTRSKQTMLYLFNNKVFLIINHIIYTLIRVFKLPSKAHVIPPLDFF